MMDVSYRFFVFYGLFMLMVGYITGFLVEEHFIQTKQYADCVDRNTIQLNNKFFKCYIKEYK